MAIPGGPESVRCPTCGYPNRTWRDGRCLRCRAPLIIAATCSGKCTACLIAAPGGGCSLPLPEKPVDPAT